MPHLLLHPLLFFIFLLSPDSPRGAAAAAAAASPPVSFSFDFTNESTYRKDDLSFLDDAEQLPGMVQLSSCQSRCQGRMSYNHSVLMYRNNDKKSSEVEVASFSTNFTFAIKTIDGGCQGEGMTFFLASYPSVIPVNSDGGDLALIHGRTEIAEGRNRFVAVEFDTYNRSTYDPPGNHIGIDLSSVRHSKNTTILPFSLNGSMTANITFDGTTRMLVASLWLHDHPSANNPFQVSYQLPDPVSSVLPAPEVAVGFSASTGDCTEHHQIMSWSFSSTLAPIPRGTYISSTLFIVLITLASHAIKFCK